MKKQTELVFILDRSGSMAGLESDTIGGFNSMLNKQRKFLKNNQIRVTTVLFDDKYELLHDRIDLTLVKLMTEKDYFVRGATALFDAMGETITKIKRVEKSVKQARQTNRVLFVIVTDGLENSSREYSVSKIRLMVKTQKAKGWEFIFLGANIDAIEVARDFSIDEDMACNFVADEGGLSATYDSVAEACRMIASDGKVKKSWKNKAEQDYKRG